MSNVKKFLKQLQANDLLGSKFEWVDDGICVDTQTKNFQFHYVPAGRYHNCLLGRTSILSTGVLVGCSLIKCTPAMPKSYIGYIEDSLYALDPYVFRKPFDVCLTMSHVISTFEWLADLSFSLGCQVLTTEVWGAAYPYLFSPSGTYNPAFLGELQYEIVDTGGSPKFALMQYHNRQFEMSSAYGEDHSSQIGMRLMKRLE